MNTQATTLRSNFATLTLRGLALTTLLAPQLAVAEDDVCFLESSRYICKDMQADTLRLADGNTSVGPFAIDETRGHTYAVVDNYDIYRVHDDGTSELMYESDRVIEDFQIDEIRGYAYWTTAGRGLPEYPIYRAPLDFSNVGGLDIDVTRVNGFVVDPQSARVYVADADDGWCDGPQCTLPGRIVRTSLDGRYQYTIANTIAPWSITIDRDACRVYWQSKAGSEIHSVGCTGGSTQQHGATNADRKVGALSYDPVGQRLVLGQDQALFTIDPSDGAQSQFVADPADHRPNAIRVSSSGEVLWTAYNHHQIETADANGTPGDARVEYPDWSRVLAVAYYDRDDARFVLTEDALYRMSPDGSPPQKPFFDLRSPERLFVDPVMRRLWISSKHHHLRSIDMDTYPSFSLFIKSASTFRPTSVTFVADEVYWVKDNVLHAADYDQYEARQVLAPSYELHALTIDPMSRTMYYLSGGEIYKSDLSGQSRQLLGQIPVDAHSTRHLVADHEDGWIYVTNSTDTFIRIGVDGGAGQSVYSPYFEFGPIDVPVVARPQCGEASAGADIGGAQVEDLDCRRVDLGHAHGRFADLHGSDFRSARLHRMDLEYPYLNDANFTGADLVFSRLYAANAKSANFTDARLVQSDLTRFFARSATFVGANLRGAVLEDGNFDRADFTDAVMTWARTDGANFSNVTWSNTICPDGTNSDDNGDTCEGHLVAFPF